MLTFPTNNFIIQHSVLDIPFPVLEIRSYVPSE
jgi:hypothetical protein